MKLLLDTHAFIWAIASPERLSRRATEALRATGNQLHLSSATPWELATKFRIGKLPQAAQILDDLDSLAADLLARQLPITHAHAVRAGSLKADHRDPFDRMIAAQAQLEGMQVITRDPAFQELGADVLW